MKNILSTLIIGLLFSSFCFAQNSVQLTINHKLGSDNFAFNTGAKNNLNDDFNISRLEYYITEFTVEHDGGQTTEINDLWVLVNANTSTEVDLGDHNITEVEGVRFHIGVDDEHNFLDPATYPSDHPLAPQNPSMHWGWASGYRFVALEGEGGANYDNTIELHGLGSQNYKEVSVNVTASASSSAVNINIDADYTRALEDIAVNSGIIVHGFDDEALDMLNNFQLYVFSSKTGTSSSVDYSEISAVSIFPNPTADGSSTLLISATELQTYQLSITDILGKEIQSLKNVNSNEALDLNFENAGLYFINLIKEDQTIITKKLVVN